MLPIGLGSHVNPLWIIHTYRLGCFMNFMAIVFIVHLKIYRNPSLHLYLLSVSFCCLQNPSDFCGWIHTFDKVFWLMKFEAIRKAKPTQLGALKITTRPNNCGRSHSLVLETRPRIRKKRRSGIMLIPERS